MDSYNLDDDLNAYTNEEYDVGIAPAPAPAPAAQQWSHAPRRVPAGMRGLSDFTPQAACEITTLAKLAYLFLQQTSDGNTQLALGTLGLFRSLYNDSQATIAPGFSAQAASILPATIPDTSWSQQMQYAMALSLVAAVGQSNAAFTTAVGAIPSSMVGVPAWFTSIHNALSPTDLTAIGAYVNSPMPTGQDPLTILTAYVRDDLSSCLGTAAPTPSPTPSPTPAPVILPSQIRPLPSLIPVLRLPTPAAQQPPTGQPQSGQPQTAPVLAPSSGSGLVTLALIAFGGLIGYGAWLAYKDGQIAKGKRLAGVDVTAEDDEPESAVGPWRYRVAGKARYRARELKSGKIEVQQVARSGKYELVDRFDSWARFDRAIAGERRHSVET